MKEWWKSKTVMAGLILALAGFLEQIAAIPGIPGWVVSVAGVVVVILRSVTTQPLKW